MAGIYIHIPFCKSRCKYCDFYSTLALSQRGRYVEALKRELELREADFKRIMRENGECLQTVYLGGGTPSTLCESNVADLINAIRSRFNTSFIKEITMEANPGDLTEEKLRKLREAGVNRLSIGIQSFNDRLLKIIGRRHSAQEALDVVRMAKRAGFTNISIDLMYGLPTETLEDWQKDVETAISLDIQHVSAYCLTYEESTPLYEALMQNEVQELPDELLNEMQDCIEDMLQHSGIIRYEISNYAKENYESKHNSSYWTGAAYMGLGAGAHSYDGQFCRQFNPDSLMEYLQSIEDGRLALTDEILTETDRFNEAVMLGLRTRKGLGLSRFSEKDRFFIRKQAFPYFENQLLEQDGDVIRATHSGTRLLNAIIEDLMKE